MSKYRARKTTIIEAVKIGRIAETELVTSDGEKPIDPPDWLVDAISKGMVRREGDKLILQTMHGPAAAVGQGIWIAREPDEQHVYPIDPVVFANRYELLK